MNWHPKISKVSSFRFVVFAVLLKLDPISPLRAFEGHVLQEMSSAIVFL